MPDYQPLHNAYNALTNRSIRWDTARMFTWEFWSSRGFVEADLRLVIKYIQNQIRLGRRREASLNFRNLVEDVARFEDDLQEARAASRVSRGDPGKEQVLRATGRTTESPPDAKPVGDVIAGMKALNELRALRDSL